MPDQVHHYDTSTSILQFHSPSIQFWDYRHAVQLLLNGFDIERGFALSDFLNIWNIRMLLSFEDRIDFLQGSAFGLNPIYSLEMLAKVSNSVDNTYNQQEDDDVPRRIDDVHLPLLKLVRKPTQPGAQ